ncbi:hypothetical protein ACFW2K_22840 [Streptomyces nigra]|uniref:hypothetical protein n=1 Tax=Streptomyces nigra TaxID=1827580 RepID=UPI0036AE486E
MTEPPMHRAERAARDAVEPYVKAGVITEDEAEEIMRRPAGFPALERAVRANLASGNGSTWYYGVRVREARTEWRSAPQQEPVTVRTARDRLVHEEIARAVYFALRADYQPPERIGDVDRYAPLFVSAPQWLSEITRDAEAQARSANCSRRAPYWVELIPLDGRTVARVGCECGGRHWDTVDLGPGVTLEEVDRFDYTILGPSKVLKTLSVRITGEFESMEPPEGQAWRLRASARAHRGGGRNGSR